jgi:hypothetical protein
MKQKKIFEKKTINENNPSILPDFEIFLNFVAENDLPASGKLELLPLKRLPELNVFLSKPLDIKLKRPVQKSFANINGLFLLARSNGLLILQRGDKAKHFAIDKEALKIWQGLNPTERYFTLVETWMIRSSIETIGEYDHIFSSPLYSLVRLFEDIDSKGMSVKDNKRFQEYGFLLYGSYNLALAEMFGWAEIKHSKTQEGKNWSIDKIKLTDFGLECIALLQENFAEFRLDLRDIYFEQPKVEFDANVFNKIKPAFQPFFLDYKNTYRLPEIEIKNGIFVFKVSLGKKVWRRIAISSEERLDDLHDIIQAAFDFGNDHLYQFEFRNRFGITQQVSHPMCEGGPSTDEFRIKQLPLRIGEKMEYIFDFGDWWVFTLELEEIKPPDPKYHRAKILKKHGEAPEQYPDWDDEW